MKFSFTSQHNDPLVDAVKTILNEAGGLLPRNPDPSSIHQHDTPLKKAMAAKEIEAQKDRDRKEGLRKSLGVKPRDTRKEDVELGEGIKDSLGFKEVSRDIAYLAIKLEPTSVLAKSISKELGSGYIDDFKKMSKNMNEIEDTWADITKDLSMDESVVVTESYTTKYPETKKAWKHFLDNALDADEWEDMLFTMAEYYRQIGEDSGDGDMKTLGKNLLKTAKDWTQRKGN